LVRTIARWEVRHHTGDLEDRLVRTIARWEVRHHTGDLEDRLVRTIARWEVRHHTGDLEGKRGTIARWIPFPDHGVFLPNR
jgi:hypothetical protein